MSDEFDKLFDTVCDARALLEDEKSVSAINGACHENVVYLADYLHHQTDFTPYIRWGAVDYYDKEYDTRMDAEHNGAIHFWVEVKLTNGNWVIADLFSMRSDEDQIQRGNAVVAPELDSYVTFPDTLYKYTPEIQPGHLLGPKMSSLQRVTTPTDRSHRS